MSDSNIESKLSRDGSRIFTWKNLSLCSRVRPKEEAERWLDRVQEDLATVDCVFVVGCGCGYHLRALKEFRKNIQIVVVDINPKIVAAAQRIHSTMFADISFSVSNAVDELKNKSVILSALRKRYAVVKFPPATQSFRRKYDDIYWALLGRTPIGIELLSTARSWGVSADSLAFENSQKEKVPHLLSLKDLSDLFDSSASPSSNSASLDRSALKVARELIV